MEVTVSRRQIKTLKASHRPRTCRHPSEAGSRDAERVGSCWASWPMPIWADQRLLCGHPEPGPYAAPSAPWQVEVWLFASWEDDKRTERANHEACGESSCRRGDTPRVICRVLNPASKSSAASSQRWTPDSPPALKPGAPFCGLGAAGEGFLGCGYGLSRAAVFCSRLGRGDRLPLPGCESGTGGFWKFARERPARPSPWLQTHLSGLGKFGGRETPPGHSFRVSLGENVTCRIQGQRILVRQSPRSLPGVGAGLATRQPAPSLVFCGNLARCLEPLKSPGNGGNLLPSRHRECPLNLCGLVRRRL